MEEEREKERGGERKGRESVWPAVARTGAREGLERAFDAFSPPCIKTGTEPLFSKQNRGFHTFFYFV